jgi:hypothetical protein
MIKLMTITIAPGDLTCGGDPVMRSPVQSAKLKALLAQIKSDLPRTPGTASSPAQDIIRQIRARNRPDTGAQ